MKDQARSEWLWARLQSTLDRREDPLADAQLCEWLESDDAVLLEFAELQGSLAVVTASGESSIPRDRSRHAGLALAGLAVVVVGLLGMAWSSGASRARQPLREEPPALVVHELRSEVVVLQLGRNGGSWTLQREGRDETRCRARDGTTTAVLHLQLGEGERTW